MRAAHPLGCCGWPPSISKSAPIDSLRQAVRAIERDLNSDWASKQAEYEEKKKIAEARHDAWEQEIAAAIKQDKARVDLPAMPDMEMPQRPVRPRLWIADATTEKVVRLLGGEPKWSSLYSRRACGPTW